VTATDRDPLPNEEQRRLLCELLADALTDIRSADPDPDRGRALAYALHNLPRTMYGWGTWSIEGQRGILAYFQAQHPGGPDYAAMFTAIFSGQR
jgi:hypothetical protein